MKKNILKIGIPLLVLIPIVITSVFLILMYMRSRDNGVLISFNNDNVNFIAMDDSVSILPETGNEIEEIATENPIYIRYCKASVNGGTEQAYPCSAIIEDDKFDYSSPELSMAVEVNDAVLLARCTNQYKEVLKLTDDSYEVTYSNCVLDQ